MRLPTGGIAGFFTSWLSIFLILIVSGFFVGLVAIYFNVTTTIIVLVLESFVIVILLPLFGFMRKRKQRKR